MGDFCFPYNPVCSLVYLWTPRLPCCLPAIPLAPLFCFPLLSSTHKSVTCGTHDGSAPSVSKLLHTVGVDTHALHIRILRMCPAPSVLILCLKPSQCCSKVWKGKETKTPRLQKDLCDQPVVEMLGWGRMREDAWWILIQIPRGLTVSREKK